MYENLCTVNVPKVGHFLKIFLFFWGDFSKKIYLSYYDLDRETSPLSFQPKLIHVCDFTKCANYNFMKKRIINSS